MNVEKTETLSKLDQVKKWTVSCKIILKNALFWLVAWNSNRMQPEKTENMKRHAKVIKEKRPVNCKEIPKMTLFSVFVGVTLGIAFGSEQPPFDVEQTVRSGTNFAQPCWNTNKLQYCRLQKPYMSKDFMPNLEASNDSKALNLKPLIPSATGYSYFGKSLEDGDCGFRIDHVQEVNNGVHQCFMGFDDNTEEKIYKVKVTVARPPASNPELRISGSQGNVFREGDLLNASCTVKGSRPHANLTIKMGDDETIQPKATTTEHASGDVYNSFHYFEYKMTWKQNGEALKCIAHHIALPEEGIQTTAQINVMFKPTEENLEEDQFGYVLGDIGIIKKVVKANPQPTFLWGVKNTDGIVFWVPEGKTDQTGRFQSKAIVKNGNGMWDASLEIHKLEADDVKNTYILRTENPEGRTDYVIRISTQDSPPVYLSFGTWGIVGAVIAGMFLVVIIIILFLARRKGKWCFARTVEQPAAGNDGNIESDTESAAHGPSVKKDKGKINLSDIFKKKKDKVAADVEELKDTNVSDIATEKPPAAIQQASDIVYAELDWQQSPQPVVKKEDEQKTEYAEILHQK